MIGHDPEEWARRKSSRYRPRDRIWSACSFETADALQRKINEDEDDSEDEAWKWWLHHSRPGWVDDGYWNVVWGFSVRRDSAGFFGQPSPLPCQHPAVHTANRYASKRDYMKRFLSSHAPSQGNQHGVAAWAFMSLDEPFPEFRQTIPTAFRFGTAQRKDTLFSSPEVERSANEARRKNAEPFEQWLKMCLPGDVLVDQLGFRFIVALSSDSTNSGGNESYWEAPLDED
jgi:hypothetical protein